MIDLKKEIDKYRPLPETDGLEEDIKNSEIEDIMDLIAMLKETR